MDFFERQEQARKNTRWLVLYLGLAVTIIVAAAYLVFAAIFLRERYDPDSLAWLWHPKLFLAVTSGTLLVIVGGALFKILELRQGGASVAASLGGEPIGLHTTDPDERKVLNVVEEMAIASGTPVPDVYLLREENGINAFAAGNSPADAVVGVTHGCVKALSRDELQGVVAHEFSHILNGDMRLNLRLIGVVHGILCIALIGRGLLDVATRSRRRLGARSRGKGEGVLMLLGLALLVIGYAGVFFGRLIKSAVSRQREFLADAAAVQFTRNPDGLAGALKKIGGLRLGSKIMAANAEEASHLFFGNGLAPSWLNLMSTHPPLAERIRLLDPAFDGKFPAVAVPDAGLESLLAQSSHLTVRPAREAGAPRMSSGLAAPGIRAAALVSQVGAPAPQHLEYASSLLAALPDPLVQASREPFGASALVYALLISVDATVKVDQLRQLRTEAPAAHYQETERLLAVLAAFPHGSKLALVDLALPALRGLSPGQYQQFKRLVKVLSEIDREVDLFEYTLQRIVRRRLEPHFEPARKPIVQFYALRALHAECTVLLSALAHVGHDQPTRKELAFRDGARQLNLLDSGATLLPIAECGLAQVDHALDRLATATPAIKRGILAACAQTVAADGAIQEREAELIRATADALDCPIPPLVAPPAQAQ